MVLCRGCSERLAKTFNTAITLPSTHSFLQHPLQRSSCRRSGLHGETASKLRPLWASAPDISIPRARSTREAKPTGVYLIITMTDVEDVPIPGEAYTFGVLKAAQALGDYGALKKRGRPVIHVHLEDESDLAGMLDLVSKL